MNLKRGEVSGVRMARGTPKGVNRHNPCLSDVYFGQRGREQSLLYPMPTQVFNQLI